MALPLPLPPQLWHWFWQRFDSGSSGHRHQRPTAADAHYHTFAIYHKVRKIHFECAPCLVSWLPSLANDVCMYVVGVLVILEFPAVQHFSHSQAELTLNLVMLTPCRHSLTRFHCLLRVVCHLFTLQTSHVKNQWVALWTLLGRSWYDAPCEETDWTGSPTDRQPGRHVRRGTYKATMDSQVNINIKALCQPERTNLPTSQASQSFGSYISPSSRSAVLLALVANEARKDVDALFCNDCTEWWTHWQSGS